jgi:hypothetical protein
VETLINTGYFEHSEWFTESQPQRWRQGFLAKSDGALLQKKRRREEIVPVRISGTYEHPTFGLDLNDKKARKVPEP